MIRSSAGLIQSSSDGAGDDITMNEDFGVSVDEAASAGFGKAAVNSSGSDGARAGTSMTGGLQSGGQQSGKPTPPKNNMTVENTFCLVRNPLFLQFETAGVVLQV